MNVKTWRNVAENKTTVMVEFGADELRTGSPEYKFLRTLQLAWDRYDAAKRQEEEA